MNYRNFIILALCQFVFGGSAHAQDAVIIGKINDSVVSGTITSIQGESLFVDSNGIIIEVELDDLNIDNVNSLFAPGMRVTAKGKFDDDGRTPIFDAEEIVHSPGGSVNAETVFLKDGD